MALIINLNNLIIVIQWTLDLFCDKDEKLYIEYPRIYVPYNL